MKVGFGGLSIREKIFEVAQRLFHFLLFLLPTNFADLMGEFSLDTKKKKKKKAKKVRSFTVAAREYQIRVLSTHTDSALTITFNQVKDLEGEDEEGAAQVAGTATAEGDGAAAMDIAGEEDRDYTYKEVGCTGLMCGSIFSGWPRLLWLLPVSRTKLTHACSFGQMLDRLFAIMRAANPDYGSGDRRRFVMKPPQVQRIGTKKSGFINFLDICKM